MSKRSRCVITWLSVDDAAIEQVGHQVLKALKELVAPLVQADGGVIYFVRASADEVHVHLTGTCAGCPGVTMTRSRLLEPVVKAIAAKATVTLTTGPIIPEGAQKVG